MGKKSEKTLAQERIKELWNERDKKMNSAKTQREKTRIWNHYKILLGKQWSIVFAYNATHKKTNFHKRVAKDRKILAMHPRRP